MGFIATRMGIVASSKGSGPTPFSPQSVTSATLLEYWDGTYYNASTGQWPGVTGAFTLTQANAAFRPTQGTVNGLGCPKFDGIDDFLSVLNFVGGGGEQLTLVTVSVPNSIAAGFGDVFNHSPPIGNGSGDGFRHSRNANRWAAEHALSPASGNRSSSSTTIGTAAIGKPSLLLSRHDRTLASTETTLRHNGVDDDNVQGTGNSAGAFDTVDPLYVGSHDGSTIFFGGRICAIALYSGIVDATDLANLEAFFSDRWNISLTAPLVNFYSGSFARASEASYHNGSTDSLAWAPSNTLRWEDRNDGAGALAVFEGARTNLLLHSEDFSNAAWTNSAGVTADALAAPDGTVDADLLTVAGTGTTQDDKTQGAAGNSTPQAYSVFLRQGSQGNQASIGRFGGFGGADLAPTANWARGSYVYTGVSTSNTVALGPTPAASLGSSGSGTTGDNHYFWGAQLEASAAFPSSYIRTSGAQATRALDYLNFTSLPPQIRSGTWQIKWSPMFASGELSAGSASCIIEDNTDSNTFRLNDSNQFVIKSATNIVLTSGAITFSRHQVLTLTVNPSAGELTIEGATTGDGTYTGTPWVWDNVAYGWGSRSGGGGQNAAFARMSEPRAV